MSSPALDGNKLTDDREKVDLKQSVTSTEDDERYHTDDEDQQTSDLEPTPSPNGAVASQAHLPSSSDTDIEEQEIKKHQNQPKEIIAEVTKAPSAEAEVEKPAEKGQSSPQTTTVAFCSNELLLNDSDPGEPSSPSQVAEEITSTLEEDKNSHTESHRDHMAKVAPMPAETGGCRPKSAPPKYYPPFIYTEAERAPRTDFAVIRPLTSSADNHLDKREHLYKVLVIGELGTGKTSIIKRYVHQFFSQHYRATIGVDFALKVLNWDNNTLIRLQLWDIAGQERFGNMTRVYYKEAVGAFIVFDVSRIATFDAVLKWKQDLDSKVQLPDGSPIPCVLLANKCDQPKEGQIINSPSKMDEFCSEKGFIGWYLTSAKDNVNIEEAAKFLVNRILQLDKNNSSTLVTDEDKIVIDGRSPTQNKGQKKCSC